MSAAPSRPSARRARGRRMLLLVATLALVLVAGAAAWLVLQPSGGTPRPSAASTSASAQAPRTAPAPEISDHPAGSDPALGTATPPTVPATVLAAARGLPANLPPVGLGQEADFGNRVSARLLSVTKISAKASRPGQRSGPALAVTVQVTNGRATPISLDTVGVNLYVGADGAPGSRLYDYATAPLRGALPPGHSESATYVFSVPTAEPDGVTVTVAYGAADGTAVFSGTVR